jgi:D-specific alpha-keto acid dehydrogenase
VVAERELRALRHLGVEHLSTRSIGVDHIDAEAAVALGIEVEAVGYEPDGVADFAVMLILMAVRNARQVLDGARGGDLRLGARTRDMGDLTVGVVGAGRIGRAVIRRLHGFGCQVLVSTRGDVAGLDAPVVPLDTLLRRSDVVTLHVPLDAANRHFIGTGEIARMRTGAVLVNTSRGALVDTAALLAALEGGRLGGAALDVIEGEGDVVYRDWRGRPLPHRPLRRLLEMPNVIVTPHCAFHTTRALDDTVDRTLAACLSNEGNHTDAQTDDRHPVRGLLRGA